MSFLIIFSFIISYRTCVIVTWIYSCCLDDVYKMFLIIKFPFLKLEHRTMQKVSQFPTTKTLLPSIYPDPIKRSFRSVSHKSHKENIHTENSCAERQPQPTTNRFVKKMSVQAMTPKFEELKGLALEEKQSRCVETKRKFSRPWLDKQIDFNKQTIKKDHLASLIQQHTSQPVKKNHPKKTLADQPVDIAGTNLSATRELILSKTRGSRRESQRNDSGGRQKITSCKIAMKRGAFPLNKKHYQELKVVEYFQREQCISVILKAEDDLAPDQFISVDSFLNIVF